jgi:hypothetical protein
MTFAVDPNAVECEYSDVQDCHVVSMRFDSGGVIEVTSDKNRDATESFWEHRGRLSHPLVLAECRDVQSAETFVRGLGSNPRLEAIARWAEFNL